MQLRFACSVLAHGRSRRCRPGRRRSDRPIGLSATGDERRGRAGRAGSSMTAGRRAGRDAAVGRRQRPQAQSLSLLGDYYFTGSPARRASCGGGFRATSGCCSGSAPCRCSLGAGLGRPASASTAASIG